MRHSSRVALAVMVFVLATGSFMRPRQINALDVARPAVHSAGSTQSGPTLLKASVIVRANRLIRYWRAPDVDNFWSWMPEVSFTVVGPVSTGSTFVIDFTNEAGAPWYSVDCDTNAVDAGALQRIGTPSVTTHIDKRTTLASGTFGFTIRLKNESSGQNEKVFGGKFNVVKFHVGNSLPAFKNQFEYVVDQDWNLPIGYLYFDMASDKNMPPVTVSMWFRSELDSSKIDAQLVYNGKQIASTKEQTGSARYDSAIFANSNEGNTRWERWTFSWGQVRGWNAETSNANNTLSIFFLNQNPGQYEVKVLRGGDLARTTKFTVGPDGRLVDNGITQKNKLGGHAMIMPVKVIGTADGQWDPNAWKSDAFYGNPLSGFAAP